MVAKVNGDGSAIMFLSYMMQLETMVVSFLKNPISVDLINNNKEKVLGLLNLFIDEGFPLFHDYNSMLHMMPPLSSGKISTNPIYPWRSNGLVYKKNQIRFNQTEYYDINYSFNGKVDFQQIRGEISVDSEMNSTPMCGLSFKNSPHFDDIAFHQCIDQNQYLSTKRLEFVPPHGSFVLSKYRINQMNIKCPIEPKSGFNNSKGRIEISISVTTDKNIDDLCIIFSILGAQDSYFTHKVGKIAQSGDSFKWYIGRVKPLRSIELQGYTTTAILEQHTTVLYKFSCDGLMTGFDIQPVSIDGGNDFTSSASVGYYTKNGVCQQKVSIQ